MRVIPPPSFVMARFMRAIQLESGTRADGKLDGPDAPGHDGGGR